MSRLNEKTGNIDIIDATTVAAISNCNTDFNADFLAQAVTVAYDIFNSFSKVTFCKTLLTIPLPPVNVIAAAGCDLIVDYFKGKKIDKVVDGVKTLIGTPIFNPALCDNQTSVGTLKGKQTFILKSGEPIEFTLSTSSFLKVSGMRTWRSNARILSDFGISGVVTGGSTQGKPYCCTRAIGTYKLASVPGAFQSLSNLQSNHGAWISGHSSTWDSPLAPIPNMYGKALGRDVCGKDQIATNREVKHIGDLPLADNILFSQYEVFDIMGRSIIVGKSKKSILEIQYELAIDNESGIYIVMGKNQKGFVETKKINLFNY